MKELIKIIKEAGNLALKAQENLTLQTKSDTSLVTNGDLLVNRFLEESLGKLYPDHSIFSEENSSVLPTKDKIIVIDPIDGTQSYAKKQNTWSILVGFLDKGEITQGVVFQPTTGKLYYAQKGKGAFLIDGNKKTKLKDVKKGKIKAYSSPSRYGENEFLKEKGIQEVEYMYSASIKLMQIAEGQGDLYPNFQQKCSLWDLVAPEIILKESGGKIIYETPQPLNFKNPLIKTRYVAVGTRLLDFKL